MLSRLGRATPHVPAAPAGAARPPIPSTSRDIVIEWRFSGLIRIPPSVSIVDRTAEKEHAGSDILRQMIERNLVLNWLFDVAGRRTPFPRVPRPTGGSPGLRRSRPGRRRHARPRPLRPGRGDGPDRRPVHPGMARAAWEPPPAGRGPSRRLAPPSACNLSYYFQNELERGYG